MTDHSLAIILQKLSFLEKTVQEIKGEVENNSKELKDVKGKVEKLNEKVKKLDEKVKKLDKRVEKLDEKVEKLRTENGHTFKMIARNEIAKKHGQHYSEGFVVFDVNGLVRLSTPKEKLSSKELEYDNQIVPSWDRQKFCDYGGYNLTKISDRETNIFVNEKLEIDVRGLLTPLTSNGEIETFNIEIGEIKKSDSTDMVTKGYRQLWLRLAVISYALSIIDPKLKCNLIGIPKAIIHGDNAF
ncbi:hypothetical protein RhiirA1_403510 [Rhizophagus irregularis]|uniref:Uncharacterized protein n=1 Tax=Rhizophagus irregularis TaxID=588596 RepID=A0A2N0QU72_9GLOM|nr:hypothetical protein RhiirA1_403510 [Rhizophagus irregularis]